MLIHSQLPIHNLLLQTHQQKEENNKTTIIMEPEVMQAETLIWVETLEQEEMLELEETLEQVEMVPHLHENNRRNNSDI